VPVLCLNLGRTSDSHRRRRAKRTLRALDCKTINMTMKVLFVCYANVGRSQVAEECFKTLSQHECESAGIAVNERIAAMKLASKKFKDYPNQSSVQYIRREFGVDIGEKERQQLVPEMIDTADLAIIIAEKERWPVYLKEGGKVLFWDIQDPAAMVDEIADNIYRQVQRRVEQLVAKIG
jgi:protein-tyrosine-phosphatase